MHILYQSFILSLSLSLILGCAESPPPLYDPNQTIDPNNPSNPGNPGNPGNNPGNQYPNNPNQANNTLQRLGEENIFVPTNGMTELKVRYLAADRRTSMINTRLTFEIMDINNQVVTEVNGSSLNSQLVNTDNLGEASVVLFGGQANEMPFRVKAYDPALPQVQPVTWTITVGDPNQGALNVEILYASMSMPNERRYTYNQFASAQVTLFREMDCNAIRSLLPTLRGGYLTPPRIMGFNDRNNQQTIPNLDRGVRISVAAMIYNQQGSPVTFGCAQGVQIMGGQTLPVVVDTFDLPLVYKGTFTSSNRFNLIQTLQESDDGTFRTIGDIFSILRAFGGDDRQIGSEIINRFCSLADIDGTICGFVRGLAADLVGGLVANEIPDNIRNILLVVGEVMNIVGDLTIIGNIIFTQDPDPMGLIARSDNRWNSMRFEWNQNCSENPDMCGTREATFNQLGSHSRSVAGVFDAQMEMDGSVSILNHNFAIAYGSIILGLMEAWIIPMVLGDQTGASYTLEDILENSLPCDRINEALRFDANDPFCRDVLIDTLSEILREQISRLNFDEDTLVMSGKFIPVDSNSDLTVDRLDQGEWYGLLDGSTEFNGCFIACRGNEECPEANCQIPSR